MYYLWEVGVLEEHKTLLLGKFSKKDACCLALLVGLIYLLVPLVIHIAFKNYSPCEFFNAEWGAGEMLGYTGAGFGALGTIYLGYVALNQNIRLLNLEESNYIAQNSCLVLLDGIKFRKIKRNLTNLQEHTEQVLFCNSNPEDGNGSFSCEIRLKNIINFPALVNVKELQIFTDSPNHTNNEQVNLHLVNPNNGYSRVAMLEKLSAFEVSVILNNEEKFLFVERVRDISCVLTVELTLNLVMKEVMTAIKCHATMLTKDFDREEGLYQFDSTDEKPPVCFWLENRKLDLKDIQTKQLHQ